MLQLGRALSGNAPRLSVARYGGYPACCLLLCLVLALHAVAGEGSDGPLVACDRAAARAERAWNLPAGLLTAIGTVESGRAGLGSPFPIAWPWSINANGRSYYAPSKAAAVDTVRLLRANGLRTIDVGCFQVDLGYHPSVFLTLGAAFDPEVNAQTAARILTRLRLSNGGWNTAIALYHSASQRDGTLYLQAVQATWPWARTHRSAGQKETAPYAVLLSPAAHLVRVITADDPPPQAPTALPHVPASRDHTAVLWITAPPQNLPRTVAPPSDLPALRLGR